MSGIILKYPGSKNRIADKIISLFPDGYADMTYLEPFFGSGSVFFRKTPSIVETINDINSEVYNLFLQIRENGDEFARLIEFTPWSRQEYEESYERNKTDIENARRFLIRCWFAIGSEYSRKAGWRYNIKNNAFNIESFGKLPEIIKEVTYRLRPKKGNVVQIDKCDAFILIEKYNCNNVLMYLDPPYVLNTRKNIKYYFSELSDADHIRLCELINKSKAKIIVSGYENEIYETYLKKFIKTNIHAYDRRGRKRLEMLWTNYSTTKGLFDEE